MECFECDGCVYYKLVRMDSSGKKKAYFCSNTDTHCYERLQFFNGILTELQELRDDVKADIKELKRNPEMISECVGRLSTLRFILELFGEEGVVISNYQS
ncbi:hypothetical protein ACFLRN_06470 [Thermoproteota archaeon]